MIKKFIHGSILVLGVLIMLLGIIQLDTWIGLAGFWQTMVGVDLVFDNNK